MDKALVEKFIHLWEKYFNGSELPITFYYADQCHECELVEPSPKNQCFIGALSKIRKGASLCFEEKSIGCGGGKRYLGFTKQVEPGFEQFLSCGLPGQFEGLRYKKSPELVREAERQLPSFEAPARYLVSKRLDCLEESDSPQVIVFFAQPDVLAGLFSLANFDEADLNGVIAPFASGCASIVLYPYLEESSKHPRGVLGMFDISARPFVPGSTLTLAFPTSKFARIVENMEESFLTGPFWKKVKKRMSRKD